MDLNSGFFEYCMVAALVLYAMSTVLTFFRVRHFGSFLIMAGFVVNLVALISLGYIGGDWYLFPMLDELRLIPAVMALLAYPVIRGKGRNEAMTVMGVLLLVTFIAVIVQTDPPMPSIKTKVMVASFFFLSEGVSAAFFLMSGALAFAALLVNSSVNESWNRLVLWGFVIFTLCQILGAIWAFIGWSYPFSWSTRHLSSASIWCFYGAAIHLRYVGMNTKSKALITIVGIIPVVFMVYHHQIIELLGVLI
ncbi:MAG: hypothetical protein JRD69_01510 [Deltaproteobacteria bacterium]|nr:hypothetical protein [Deltaproteobacteria bacterium]